MQQTPKAASYNTQTIIVTVQFQNEQRLKEKKERKVSKRQLVQHKHVLATGLKMTLRGKFILTVFFFSAAAQPIEPGRV